MATGDSPAGARRRLRLEIRKAREATGRTQGQVAEALNWSLSKVNRIENGDVTISSTDLDALLRLLGVSDSALIERMAADARAARKRGRGWWDEPRFREHVRPTTLQMLQFESEASAIRAFNYAVIPGLLQTREYAEAAIGNVTGDLSPEARVVRTDLRMLRQRKLRSRPDVQCLVILDELLLQRTVGSAAVMAEQLRTLTDAARRANVVIRLLPRETSWPYIAIGTFILFDFDNVDSAVLYREFSLTDEIVHSADVVNAHRARFEQMWHSCLSEEASVAVIEAAHASLRAALVRRG
ncbi:helix-turn-helix transcriptional regulator [Dactylosporangium sp. AC04546]|uniref:helix-turn-helix domain-containing protein n=1 Tax=Dactylosporangium sp. AC04546 TaxID=2862460 RepID=UPI001EDD98AE|nr:helix-turn-helix transcriptional regulator [Dactylosporangium sp. AC04546]WVK81367.1 helix-turn-helix transcriptional regulator [Dactylosporangium sp. AC04546]